MGQQLSTEELLFQQVRDSNVECIKSLSHKGAGLECVEKEGRTPLILACSKAKLHDVSKTDLLELGSDVNAYRSGSKRKTRRSGYISQARRWAQVDRQIKPAAANEGNMKQLNWFCQACKGFPQPINPPMFLQTTENIKSNELTTSASLLLAVTKPAVQDDSVHCPSIPSANCESKENGGGFGVCVICMDSSSEAACVPCGHVAGCVSCLKEIKNNKLGCPVCRANIDQVVKLYHV